MDLQCQKLLHNQEEDQESISHLISTIPQVLSVTDRDAIEVGNYFLPYSIGIEIECEQNNNYDIKRFKDIPHILEVASDQYEQRFRIPSGIKGLHCLYDLSLLLKEMCLLNPLSGIHYHVDWTESYDYVNQTEINKEKDWILAELDSWRYSGTFNKRDVTTTIAHKWIRFQSSFKTMEVRIGEMTFDYCLLFERIRHISHISRRLKVKLESEWTAINSPILLYKEDHEIKSVLTNRILKI